MQADLDACNLAARDVHRSGQDIQDKSAMAGPGIGVPIGSMLVAGYQDQKAREAYVRRCMHAKKYLHLAMTSDEVTAFAKLKTTDDRSAFFQTLYQNPDFSSRVEAAANMLVPPLPTAADQPLTYSGIRFDPANLIAATGIIHTGEKIISGPVSHRRTARLVKDAVVPIPDTIAPRAKKGSIFYQVVLPGEDGPKETYWCGEMIYKTIFGDAHVEDCVINDEEGYGLVPPLGQIWHPTGFTHFLGEARTRVFYSALILDQSQQDLVGSMVFDIIISHLGKDSATLEAHLSKDGKTETFWTRELTFDAAGKAILPFWDHQIVLNRSGEGVSVKFTADGDLKDWDAISGS